LLPLVTAFAITFGQLIGNNVVVETVFSCRTRPNARRCGGKQRLSPGAGRLLMIAFVLVLLNFVADLLYGLLVQVGAAWLARRHTTCDGGRRPATAPQGQRAARAIARPYALIGVSIYLSFLLVAVFANRLASYDPTEILFTEDGGLASALPPQPGALARHHQSWPRRVLAARAGGQALAVRRRDGGLALAAIGTVVGLITGYLGGIVDRVLMRLADMVLASPSYPSSSSRWRCSGQALGISAWPSRYCYGRPRHASSAARF